MVRKNPQYCDDWAVHLDYLRTKFPDTDVGDGFVRLWTPVPNNHPSIKGHYKRNRLLPRDRRNAFVTTPLKRLSILRMRGRIVGVSNGNEFTHGVYYQLRPGADYYSEEHLRLCERLKERLSREETNKEDVET